MWVSVVLGMSTGLQYTDEEELSLRAAGRWIDLAELLLERATHASEEFDAAVALCEVANVYSENLSNPDAARAILLKALIIDPGHVEAADLLEQSAWNLEHWQEAATALQESAQQLSHSPIASGDFWVRAVCAVVIGCRDSSGFSMLRQVEQASAAAEPYLAALESSVVGLESLESLLWACSHSADRTRSSRLLSRAIAMSQSMEQRANYHERIAENELLRSDMGAAEWNWREVLRLDPRNASSRKSLGELYRSQGEFRKAAALLEHARACANDQQERVRLTCEAATLYSDVLGENTRAVDLYASALQLQPNHHQAAVQVIDRYYEQERWRELRPLLHSVLSQEIDSAEASELRRKAGDCAMALESFHEACQHFDAAAMLDPLMIPAILGAARACAALGEHELVIKRLKHADLESLHSSKDHISESLFLSAQANQSLGRQDLAVQLYERCIDAGHVGATRSLADLYSCRGEHDKSVDLRLRELPSLAPKAKVEALCEIGEIFGDHLNDLGAAIKVFGRAHVVDPGSLKVLHALTNLYVRSQLWREAMKTLIKMVALEPSAERCGRYLQAAGKIADQEDQIDEAIALLGRAVDYYFGDVEPERRAECRVRGIECFRQADGLLRETTNWSGVEKSHRSMIKHLDPGDPEVAELWSSLGKVYHEHLGRDSAAIDSYEVASALDSGRMTHHRILIDLYEGAGADKIDKAIERRRLLIEMEPTNPEHYKALRGLYVRTRQMDRVWCVCRALDYLGAADSREQAFYDKHLQPELAWPARSMDSGVWSRLRDPDVDRSVLRIFGLIAEIIALDTSITATQTDVRDECSADFDPLRQLFSATSYALGLPTFDVLVQPHRAHRMSLLNLRRGIALEPAFSVGRDLYQGRTVPQLVHDLARVLFFGRRAYYLRMALQPQDIVAAFYAAVSLVRPNSQVPPAFASSSRRYRRTLSKKLHPTWIRSLRDAVELFLSAGSTFQVETWIAGSDATARHAALLLSGDLSAGMSALKVEHQLSKSEKTHWSRRLLNNSVSELHFSLREELGVCIKSE